MGTVLSDSRHRPDENFQVFISYSRNDNNPWHTPADAKGFVSYFHDALHRDLTDHGVANVKLWRDVKRVYESDQFEPVLEREISASAALLVILSPNWLASKYCRHELDVFESRWAHEGAEAVKARIILVNKQKVALGRRPSLLMGQVGVSFYSELDADSIEEPLEFFARGEVRASHYYDKIEQVRKHLVTLARHFDAGTSAPPSESLPLAPRSPGRAIYVAQPANDMIAHYDVVVRELQGRGHVVVPERGMPSDSTAAAFIDSNLAKAYLAVHLLGEKRGFTPDDAAPIVQLQLERSAMHTASSTPGADSEVAPKPLRRILWAPRALIDDGAPVGDVVDRDPIAVLEKFGGKLLPGDKIDGQARSRFINFLLQEVERSTQAFPATLRAPGNQPPGQFLFVSHVNTDRAMAESISEELEARGVPCWIAPRDVHPGKPYDNEISDAIDICLAMLLIFSARCNESDYIRRELTVAGEAGKLIIPFRIEDAQPKHGLRLRLIDLHWIDAFANREAAIDKLLKVVHRVRK